MALLSDKINGVKTIIGLQSPAKAGFLQSYGGVTAPSGWLACDGTAVSRTTYSQLFANIGTKYGVGDPVLCSRFPFLCYFLASFNYQSSQ